MTNSQHAALIRSLLSMQRRCDALAERMGVDFDADPETDPAMAIHCVSASLEMAMQAADYALGNA
jgi:hypothetical protein